MNVNREFRIVCVNCDAVGIVVCTENPIRVYRMLESAKLAR